MLINVYTDIEKLKKEYEKYNCNETDDIIEIINNNGSDDYMKFENNLNNLYELIQSMEGINNEVVNNKNLLKSVLDEDHEIKKRYIEKIKSIINAYVSFYDYVDNIKQHMEESNIKNGNVMEIINSILSFLEKEYLNIGITVHIPSIGVDKFDIHKHEIVATEKRINLQDNVITSVKKKGFYYNDRNIRYVRNAKVVTVLNS